MFKFLAYFEYQPEILHVPLQVDIDSLDSLKAILEDAAIVVHTAGPFQRKEGSLVLEAAIATR